MIHDVEVIPLQQILDERGKVMHMLRADAPHFRAFGEIYFSAVHPGVVKGWQTHTRMMRNYAVPIGKIKLVLFDDRAGSPSKGELQELYLGPDNYNLVVIPPMIWSGFKGLGSETSLVANCGSLPHDPAEVERLDLSSERIPYSWVLR
jgi:dTDP-4-dehydrorhamnose 3,5-epimerase